MKSKLFVLLASLIVALFAAHSTFGAKRYSYFRVGSPNDISASTTAGTVLMGGGTDVDAAFQWMCQRSGGGDFLVIRATGTDAYNPYIQQLCPSENSVATLIIPNRTAASDPAAVSRSCAFASTCHVAPSARSYTSRAPSSSGAQPASRRPVRDR